MSLPGKPTGGEGTAEVMPETAEAVALEMPEVAVTDTAMSPAIRRVGEDDTGVAVEDSLRTCILAIQRHSWLRVNGFWQWRRFAGVPDEDPMPTTSKRRNWVVTFRWLCRPAHSPVCNGWGPLPR
ncbi:hypothetical protein [Candidatus Thiothrix anitrata]|uniref:Uncharacterized protein n=1 Tax=Candidatus Thiothrix anitrata TaxID=2823902 RepID=A0ABX7X593_9GAMM|nr:hypothetical protein [Candidatus Thiothrix anitrata]QTR49883.1 hypothetical protein J8380_16950 [Candidatus Thiothrix anitrata]